MCLWLPACEMLCMCLDLDFFYVLFMRMLIAKISLAILPDCTLRCHWSCFFFLLRHFYASFFAQISQILPSYLGSCIASSCPCVGVTVQHKRLKWGSRQTDKYRVGIHVCLLFLLRNNLDFFSSHSCDSHISASQQHLFATSQYSITPFCVSTMRK